MSNDVRSTPLGTLTEEQLRRFCMRWNGTAGSPMENDLRSMLTVSESTERNAAIPERLSSLENSEVKPDGNEGRSGEVDREGGGRIATARGDAVGAGRTECGTRPSGREADREGVAKDGAAKPAPSGSPSAAAAATTDVTRAAEILEEYAEQLRDGCTGHGEAESFTCDDCPAGRSVCKSEHAEIVRCAAAVRAIGSPSATASVSMSRDLAIAIRTYVQAKRDKQDAMGLDRGATDLILSRIDAAIEATDSSSKDKR